MKVRVRQVDLRSRSVLGHWAVTVRVFCKVVKLGMSQLRCMGAEQAGMPQRNGYWLV